MTDEEIRLSRRAAEVIEVLTLDARLDLIAALDRATSLGDVAEPYRSWLRDVRTIPADRRLNL